MDIGKNLYKIDNAGTNKIKAAPAIQPRELGNTQGRAVGLVHLFIRWY